MIRIVILLLFFVMFFETTLGQAKKFYGNWIGCDYWGMNYYKIKKSQRVIWYSNNCTDRGTKHDGKWKSIMDTITLSFDNNEVKYIYIDGKLCFFSDEGNHGTSSNGIPKTNRFTIVGVKNKCRSERKKKRKIVYEF